MSLTIKNPQQTINTTCDFIKRIYKNNHVSKAVIAVSGGIDSALSLTLATRALGSENIIPVFLPYKDQDMSDAKKICDWNKIDKKQWIEISLEKEVDFLSSTLKVQSEDTIRKGNIMARVRMIMLYDIAKKHQALVCGTENKSEKLLGYFTRFGDEASDLEPIDNFYKTQVRQLVTQLKIPSIFLEKKPSAGLWQGQTDEQQFGFSYEDADQVLYQTIEENKNADQITGIEIKIVKKVLLWMKNQSFKHEVPYTMSK